MRGNDFQGDHWEGGGYEGLDVGWSVQYTNGSSRKARTVFDSVPISRIMLDTLLSKKKNFLDKEVQGAMPVVPEMVVWPQFGKEAIKLTHERGLSSSGSVVVGQQRLGAQDGTLSFTMAKFGPTQPHLLSQLHWSRARKKGDTEKVKGKKGDPGKGSNAAVKAIGNGFMTFTTMMAFGDDIRQRGVSVTKTKHGIARYEHENIAVSGAGHQG